MNAYELAEQAKEISTTIEALEWVQKVSPLLIQQEKQIERLIGSEPITYGMLTFCKNCGEQNPYYTAPKELSDEEIKLIKGVVGDYVCTLKMEIDQQKQAFKGYEHCSNLDGLNNELKDSEQALAILKKASEK